MKIENSNETMVLLAPDVGGEKNMWIKASVWEKLPKGSEKRHNVDRVREFFADPEIPMSIRALGVIMPEIGNCLNVFQNDDDVVSGLFLFEDRLVVAMSDPDDYGKKLPELTSLPLADLDRLTGNVADRLASDNPEIIEACLGDDFRQGQLNLMRLLAKQYSYESGIKVISEMGGLGPPVGLGAFTNGEGALLRMYLKDIPQTDPILGETVLILRELEVHETSCSKSFSHSDFKSKTSWRINEVLEKIPRSIGDYLFCGYGVGRVSYEIYQLLVKLGYQHSQLDRDFEEYDQKSKAMYRLWREMNTLIVETILEGKSVQESGLTPEGIDGLYRKAYSEVNTSRNKEDTLPDDFSIIWASRVAKAPADVVK